MCSNVYVLYQSHCKKIRWTLSFRNFHFRFSYLCVQFSSLSLIYAVIRISHGSILCELHFNNWLNHFPFLICVAQTKEVKQNDLQSVYGIQISSIQTFHFELGVGHALFPTSFFLLLLLLFTNSFFYLSLSLSFRLVLLSQAWIRLDPPIYNENVTGNDAIRTCYEFVCGKKDLKVRTRRKKRKVSLRKKKENLNWPFKWYYNVPF